MPGGIGSTVGRQRQREQVAADREQHVVLLEHLARLPARSAHHLAAEQRMRGRERGRVGHELGVDRRAEQLGELDQLARARGSAPPRRRP